jgi:DNA-binding NarL/FixJ family response regulator
VAIVSDDALARAYLAAFLSSRADVAALLNADSDTADALSRFGADVVIWDLGANGRADLAGLRAAVDVGHTVVALITDEAQGAEALAAGAVGVHLRKGTGERLPLVHAAASAGLVVLDDAVKARLVGTRRSALAGLPLDPLTAREREVLALRAEGRSNRDVALALGIAERTAKFHVNAILEKLDADGHTEAVAGAARLGLVVM